MKSTNTVNNAFPYAKFSRNSLMFELGTVPEFGKYSQLIFTSDDHFFLIIRICQSLNS